MSRRKDDAALTIDEVLREELELLHGTKLPRDATLQDVLAAAHALGEAPAALCLSGGGIRSATFALGVLQALARRGLLGQFHYLSTVSGGGYIGGWLTSWIERHPRGLEGVSEDLWQTSPQRQGASGAFHAAEPPHRAEPVPLLRLRAFSNFLTPRLGLFSADTWSVVGTILRNLLLNWLVLVPALLAVLLLPRLFVAALAEGSDAAARVSFWTGTLLLVWAIAFIAAYRPSLGLRGQADTPTQARFLAGSLLPLLAGSVLVVYAHAWLHPDACTPVRFAVYGTLVHSVAWGTATARLLLREWRGRAAGVTPRREPERALFRVLDLVAALGSGAIGGLLAWVAAERVLPAPLRGVMETLVHASLAVTLLLGAFLLASTVYIALISRDPTTGDEDLEWWARSGGWTLLVSLLVAALGALVLLGPLAVAHLGRAIPWGSIGLGSLGGVSGIVTLVLGRGSTTPARPGAGRSASDVVLRIAAPLFLVSLLLGLAWTTDTMLVATSRLVGPELPAVGAPGWMLDVRARSSLLLLGALAAGLVLITLVMARRINVNKFSLHAMYRNRLIRAYLGATRADRTPNAFTGFDPDDNLPMGTLLPWAVRESSFPDGARGLADAWKRELAVPRPADPVVATIPAELKHVLVQRRDGGEVGAVLRRMIVAHLNGLLTRWDREGFDLARGGPSVTPRQDTTRANRDALVRRYAGLLLPPSPAPPRLFPVVNCALNLVRGESLAWQQRKAASFTFTPLHTGAALAAVEGARGQSFFRRTPRYGGELGPSLGTAMAISGAAVSPNMGYHSSALITFLLTLFNARLGWWLPNPGRNDPKELGLGYPRDSLRPLLTELFGLTGAQSDFVYLSDGGHFENLGLYEMVRRRCRVILCVDAGCDPEFSFADLGNAIRKIRVDLGIPVIIDPRTLTIRPRRRGGEPVSGGLCRVGTIRYEAVDGAAAAEPGRLVYVKPLLCDRDEPADVLNYARENPAFPHQSTSDQWFSESQLEAYRSLGLYIMGSVCDDAASRAARVALTPWGMAQALAQPSRPGDAPGPC